MYDKQYASCLGFFLFLDRSYPLSTRARECECIRWAALKTKALLDHNVLTFRWPKSDCDVDNCTSKYQLLLALACWTWTCELSCLVYLTSNNPLVKITFYYDYRWCALFNRFDEWCQTDIAYKNWFYFWLNMKCINKWVCILHWCMHFSWYRDTSLGLWTWSKDGRTAGTVPLSYKRLSLTEKKWFFKAISANSIKILKKYIIQYMGVSIDIEPR